MANKNGHSGFNASQANKAKALGIKVGGGAPMPQMGGTRDTQVNAPGPSMPVMPPGKPY
jgi:hypothetical protein